MPNLSGEGDCCTNSNFKLNYNRSLLFINNINFIDTGYSSIKLGIFK